jgi:hypothetical protein
VVCSTRIGLACERENGGMFSSNYFDYCCLVRRPSLVNRKVMYKIDYLF